MKRISSPPVKIGIVGAGIWGRNHALALSSHPPGEVAIICDTDAARARQLAEEHGCAWTTSLDELAGSDVQAVTIATPDHLHTAPTLLMLAAGKHVLVEKPLATTVADARKMVEAAEAAGVKFMVDFHARWHPLFMGAKEYVESGKVGDPVLAYARLSDTIYVPTEMLPWAGQSGPEWFLFPHVMDVVRWILDSEPVEVFARGHRGVLAKRGIDCWDAIQALFEFENGAICTFETAWILPNSYTNVVDNRLSLVGSRGRTRAAERAEPLGLHRSVPHPLLVRVDHPLRQGLGLSVRVDPLLHRLRRQRRDAGGRRPGRARRHRHDRGEPEIARGASPREDGRAAGLRDTGGVRAIEGRGEGLEHGIVRPLPSRREDRDRDRGQPGAGPRIALAFAEAGADVVITGRHQDTLDRTAAEIRAHGRKAGTLEADMAVPEKCEAAFHQPPGRARAHRHPGQQRRQPGDRRADREGVAGQLAGGDRPQPDQLRPRHAHRRRRRCSSAARAAASSTSPR